mmetsp:Transcript_285/g.600  ORF Transcript_285/g.600 Transcript_285/m.600 type:complete len:1106 (+) Transcript_285:85-3402(+)
MPAASCSVSVDSSVAMTTVSSVEADNISDPEQPPKEHPREFPSPPATTLDLDDAVFVIDPIAGVLQGIVTHLGEEDDDENVGIQLTGPSLGQGSCRKKSHPSASSNSRQQPRQNWSVHIAHRNFVSRPIERVYKRLVTLNGSSSKLYTDEFINAFIEQRQSTVKPDRIQVATTSKKKKWSFFSKRQPALCQQDLDYLEHLLSANHSIAFCLWDAHASTISLASPAFVQLTGYSYQRILGRSLDVLAGPQTNVAHSTAWKEALGQTGNCHICVLHYRPTEESFFHRMFLTPLCLENDNRIRYYLSLHAKVTASDAARINHEGGWPMPAIFNLKGSFHHHTTLDVSESVGALSGVVETQVPASHSATVETVNSEDSATEPEKSSKESNSNIDLPRDNGEYDVSKWLPEFSAHEAKLKSPKKVKKYHKKKKVNHTLSVEAQDAVSETPSLQSETDVGENALPETLTNNDSQPGKVSKEHATQSETHLRHSRKMSASKNESTTKNRRSKSSKRNSRKPHENTDGGGNRMRKTSSTPRRGRSGAPEPGRESPRRSVTPSTPRRGRSSAPEPGGQSPGRSVVSRREGSKTRQPGVESPRGSTTPLRENISPRRSSTSYQDKLLSPASQNEDESDSSSTPDCGQTKTIDLLRDDSIGDLHDLLFSQPSSLSTTHHTMTSYTTEQTPVMDNPALDYEPITVTPRTPSKAAQTLTLQQGNSDFANLCSPNLQQKEFTADESKNGLPRRSSAPLLRGGTIVDPESASSRRSSAPPIEFAAIAESESSSPRRKASERRKPTESPRRRSSTEPGHVSPRRRRSAESGRASSRRRTSTETKRSNAESGRKSPQRDSCGSPRRKSGESSCRSSGKTTRRASGESERTPSRRTHSKAQEEDLNASNLSLEEGASPRSKAKPEGAPDRLDAEKQSPQRSPPLRQGMKKHLPVQTQTDDSSSSSSDDSEAGGQINLLRDNSIGDLHDLLFSQSASLSATHHTMTLYTEEQSLVLDENEAMVMSPKPPPSPRSLLDTVRTVNSISEVHDLLYSQRNMSVHTVTNLSEADPSVVTEYESEPLSPINTQHTATSISDVHSVLFNQSTDLSTATEHSIPASTMSNE